MRLFLGISIAILLAAAAQAQPYTLADMIRAGIAQCIQQHYGQPNAESLCACYVRRWVGLWDRNDIDVWTNTGAATPHMQAMEGVAVSQCGI